MNGPFVLVATPFGYPIYVADNGTGYSDRPADATVYDASNNDNPVLKARFFKAITTFDFSAQEPPCAS